LARWWTVDKGRVPTVNDTVAAALVEPPASLRRSLCLILLAGASSGCVTLKPWHEAIRGVDPRRFVEVDGRKVHVERAGSGPPVVLLHGFGESTFAWSRVLPALARHFHVVAIDLNGFGYTQRPRDRSAYTLAGQARLVLDVLDRLDLGEVRLAGHSYGGGIALYLAVEHPERVDRLLLVDNTLPLYASERRGSLLRWRWIAELAVRTFGLRDGRIESGLEEAYFDDRRVTPDLVREYARRLRIEGAADAYRGLLGPSPEPPYRIDLATVRQPALVIWGENDALIPVATARRLTAEMPRAEFVVLPACGHTPMEECPEPLLAAALPFLAAP
jgi:pimeloyl-ACP methyl ester carboxylesterase